MWPFSKLAFKRIGIRLLVAAGSARYVNGSLWSSNILKRDAVTRSYAFAIMPLTIVAGINGLSDSGSRYMETSLAFWLGVVCCPNTSAVIVFILSRIWPEYVPVPRWSKVSGALSENNEAMSLCISL